MGSDEGSAQETGCSNSHPAQSNWLERTWRGLSSKVKSTVYSMGLLILPIIHYHRVWNKIDSLVGNEDSYEVSLLDSSKESRRRGVNYQRGLRVIVVDGGGSLGVVPATILVEIEREVARIQAGVVNQKRESLTIPKWKDARKWGAEYDNRVFLADHVDLFCGTSAGGMTALAHAHGRLKLWAVQELFTSGAAFAKKYPKVPYLQDYPVERLEKAMDQVYKKFATNDDDEARRLDQGAMGKNRRAQARDDFNEERRMQLIRPYVFAVSNPVGNPAGVLFTNYTMDDYARSATLHQHSLPRIRGDVSPAEATRATSAAPYFYPPMRFDERNHLGNTYQRYYVDGGLSNNSPVDVAVMQAQMLFGPRRNFEIIISVGCGVASDEAAKQAEEGSNFGRCSFFRKLVESYLVDSTAGYERVMRVLALDPRFKNLVHNGLHRLNPDLQSKSTANLDTSDESLLANIADEVAFQCQPGGELHGKIHEIAVILADMDQANLLSPHALHSEDSQELWKLLRQAEYVMTKRPAPVTGNAPPLNITFPDWRQQYELDDIGFIHLVDFLEACLKTYLPPTIWIQLMKNGSNDVLCNAVEDARALMNRGFILGLGKTIGRVEELTSEKCHDLVQAFDARELLRIILVQLEYDRVNALHFLQYNRGKGPRGKFWGTKSQWNKFKEVFKDDFGSNSDFGCDWNKERPTISQNLESLMKVLDYCVEQNDAENFFNVDDLQQLKRAKELFSCEIPTWIAVQFPEKTLMLKRQLI